MTDIRSGKFAPVYLISGEEVYYIDKLVEALEQSVVPEDEQVFDQNILYGNEVQMEAVIEASTQYPVLASKKLVVLKEAQTMQNAKNQLERLKHYVSKPTPTTVLVVAFKGGKISGTSSMMKTAAKNNEIIVFDSPKIRDYQMPEAIKDFCRTEKIQIEDKAVAMLVDFVGASLDKVVSEIEKLQVAIKREDKKITAVDIEQNIGISKDFNNFELVTAIARRDYPMAMRILKYFADNPKNNPAIVAGATIFGFFQKLVIAHFCHDKTDKALMEALQLKNAYALREIRSGMASYNATQSVNAIHSIRDFDKKSKGIGSTQGEQSLLKELVFSLLTS